MAVIHEHFDARLRAVQPTSIEIRYRCSAGIGATRG